MSGLTPPSLPLFNAPPGAEQTLQDRIERLNTSVESLNEQLGEIPANSGLLHTYTPKKKVNFIGSGNQMIQEHNGAYLVMGTDQPGHKGTGQGASGATKGSTIDLVTGRGASLNDGEGPGDGWFVGNMFSTDAARIYISESTNIDKNFGISPSPRDANSGRNDHALSGIGIKADNVRIIGRNNIKIVTGRNQGFTGQKGGKEPNSLGGHSSQGGTISLIGGNYADGDLKYLGLYNPSGLFMSVPYLQPAIKGDNLVACLENLYAYIDKIASALNNTIMSDIGVDTGIASSTAAGITAQLAAAFEVSKRIPYGLQLTYEARMSALTDRQAFLGYGGEMHIRSQNVYLT